MKLLFTGILLSVSLWANCTSKFALIGKIINVAENDVLNVHAEPDYRSKKIGELLPSTGCGLTEECKRIGKSTWCKIHELAAYGDDKTGWVNAYYLSFIDKGYVTIKGKENSCFYALKCKNKASKTECLVVLNYITDAKGNAKELKIKWFDRALLRGESQFGVASNDKELNPEGGFCTSGRWIEDYLQKHPNFIKGK